jgi:hypothetical protein
MSIASFLSSFHNENEVYLMDEEFFTSAQKKEEDIR